MTRFGVMKHLKVLEEAGLVVTRRRGREKLHFLNPVPIRLIHDRWVSKYSEPWVCGDSPGSRTNWRGGLMEKVFEIYIKTTPERLWEAITDSELRAKYNFGVGIASDWTAGSGYEADAPGVADADLGGREPRGRPAAAARPELQRALGRRRQERGHLDGSPGRSSRSATRAGCVVTHDELREGANEQLFGGWPMILSRPQDAAGDRRGADDARGRCATRSRA